MSQLNEGNLRLFTRAIMPELYRLQEKRDYQRIPKGAVFQLANEDDMDKLLSLLSKSEAAPNYLSVS